MKNVDAAVKNAIRTAHDVKALPRLTAEWNMNRYSTPTASNDIANWEALENDIDMFPIESIIEPIRPTKGINKARINYGTLSDSYTTPSMPRYYVASLEDKYMYWTSPTASDAAGNIANVAPKVIYSAPVRTNKIVVTVENTWASPTTWSIQTTQDGVNWQTASSAPVIGNDGRAVLYWNGGSWSSTRPASLAAITTVRGVRVVVTRLGGGIGINGAPTQARLRSGAIVNTSGAGSYFSLIEMGARLEIDLSDSLIENSDTFDGGDVNQITPVGTITSNVASLNLWNGDNALSAQLAGLLEPNVKMNLEYVYYIGAQTYPVQQFSMYTESWSEKADSTISVDLSDASKYLKEIYPREAKYENVTLAQVVYRLLDQVGFTDYNIINHGYINDFRIPVFWVDGTETIWEVFDQLATATQSLIYFDAYGRLNVKSREQAFNPARPVDWTLRGTNSGNELADIVELDKTGQFDSNLIKVRYKNTDWAESINGHVQNTTTWSPEDTVTLRATPLLGGLTVNEGEGSFFSISPGEVVHWPYEGHVQIEGEFIEYSGKWFNYLNANGAWESVWVHDQKEYDKYNEIAGPNRRVHNHFLGRLKIVERGVWNSAISDHTPEAKGWSVKRYNYATNNSWNSNSTWQWLRGASCVRMSSNGDLQNTEQWAVALRGQPTELPYRKFGTRFRFNGAALHHRAGIVFYAQGNGDGYYVECRPTNTIENKDRDTEDEITLYSIHGNNYKKMKANWRAPDLIVADTWHDLEVGFDPASHTIHIWLDGKRVMSDVIQPTNYRHNPTGKFGMFIRGQTNVDFEYFYAVSVDEPWLSDNATWHDRVQGAYVGENWFRDRVLRTRQQSRWVKRKGKKKGKRKVNKKFEYANFMDEFGPYVHEVREFDVKFDPAPVKTAFLYMSNDYGIVCPEFRSDSHGAYFILANASRRNEIAHGDDSMSFAAAGATVNQQLLVYGRALVIGEDEEVEVRNEAQIRARGEIVAEIDSPWIQSESAAQAVADWIAAHWANGADQLQVEVFGNPLFELGDVVAIDHAAQGMTPVTHQYFVTGIDTDFDAGINTTLTLQRKN